jgi:acyl-coenzyme A thioesterase PaaI-like protein
MTTSATDGEMAELLAGLRALGDGLAFNQHLGAHVEALEVGRAVTRLADDPALHNHLGGVHAIAELAPVELAGALAAATRLRAVIAQGFVPVVGELTARYTAPARGELTATAVLGPEAEPAAVAAVEAGQRPRATVAVTVTDRLGVVVVEAELVFLFLDAREAQAANAG